jgi:hypothetical protein
VPMNPYNSASGKVEVTALPTGFVIYTGRQAERLSADVPKRPASLICVQHDAVAPPTWTVEHDPFGLGGRTDQNNAFSREFSDQFVG